jgi:cell wall-associated NlpC family hydrolase
MERTSLRMARNFGIACLAFFVSACATPQTSAQLRIDSRLALIDRPAVRTHLRQLRPVDDALVANRAAALAQSMIGRPYRWGGESPSSGFDCSGLVYYAYGRAGADVPRTSRELYGTSTPVPLERARTGDLVFFRLGNKLSHVGIYLDDGRFVHAPSTGKRVEIASLRSGWYERNFIRAGRLPLD